MTWSDFRSRDSDVLFSKSTDGGASWSQPVRVNTDPVGNGRHQFFPEVTSDGIILDIGPYFDNRLDPMKLDVFLARSTDQGVTFTEQRVTDVSSNPNTNEFPNNNFIGDYLGLDVSETSVYPAWTDFRNGTQDVFIKRLPADPNGLRVGIGIDRAVLTGGQKTLVRSAEGQNGPSAPTITADILFGVGHPDGNTLTFFTDLSGGQAVGTVSNPGSWVPFASNVIIGAGTDAVYPGVLQVSFASAAPGIYTPFLALKQGTNIRALSFKEVTVQ